MNALWTAAGEVSGFMMEKNWRHCLIGGLAVQRWGEPRTTLDADFTLLTGWGEELHFAKNILANFTSRIKDPEDFAIQYRVLLIKASNGKDIDICMGALPFEEEMMNRAILVPLGKIGSIPCCTAEDLFIMKMMAGRPRDIVDAESIIARQPFLDKTHILKNLKSLCEINESKETLERAEFLLKLQS